MRMEGIDTQEHALNTNEVRKRARQDSGEFSALQDGLGSTESGTPLATKRRRREVIFYLRIEHVDRPLVFSKILYITRRKRFQSSHKS